VYKKLINQNQMVQKDDICRQPLFKEGERIKQQGKLANKNLCFEGAVEALKNQKKQG